jgi:hypothetical protein
MTTNERFDRRLSTWLDRDASGRVPDHLDEVLVRTAATRQRPWWSSPERWLPMDLTTRANALNPPRIGRLSLVLGLLLIALIVATLVVVGTRRQVPPPFGPARNGAVITSHDGDIYKVDPATGAAVLLIGGPGVDFGPGFSRDGTKISFLRGTGINDQAPNSGLAMVVADADGTNVRQLTPFIHSIDWADWSADSKQIVYLSRRSDDGPGMINVVNVDGSGTKHLDIKGSAHFVSWLPPYGQEIVFRLAPLLSSGGLPGIWAVHPDGTGLRALSTRPAENGDDYMAPAVAPDGSRISYGSNGPISHIHILDLTTGKDLVLPDPTGGLTNQGGNPYFSPDGKSVGYLRMFAEDNTFQFVIAPVDGSGTGTPVGPRLSQPTGDVNWEFAPDGASVVVDYDLDKTVWRLPVDGSPGTVLTQGTMGFGDIQRVAP